MAGVSRFLAAAAGRPASSCLNLKRTNQDRVGERSRCAMRKSHSPPTLYTTAENRRGRYDDQGRVWHGKEPCPIFPAHGAELHGQPAVVELADQPVTRVLAVGGSRAASATIDREQVTPPAVIVCSESRTTGGEAASGLPALRATPRPPPEMTASSASSGIPVCVVTGIIGQLMAKSLA